MSDPSPLAAVLRAELDRRGWPVAELARQSGLAAPSVWRYLHGGQEPGFAAALALVRGLGKSLAWLERELKRAA